MVFFSARFSQDVYLPRPGVLLRFPIFGVLDFLPEFSDCFHWFAVGFWAFQGYFVHFSQSSFSAEFWEFLLAGFRSHRRSCRMAVGISLCNLTDEIRSGILDLIRGENTSHPG